ncbi:MAG: PQQ-binding-like beta-propeller repeat protein [bacterium]
MRSLCIVLSIVALVCFLSKGAASVDWTRWRGPDGNGITTESDWDPETLKKGPRILWRVALGEGYSSVSVQGPYLYTMGNNKNTDIVYCLNVKDGSEVWRYSYPCSPGNYPGPRATPVIDGPLIYTLSRDGHLFALNAKNGTVTWQKNILTELKAKNIKWGFASTPSIDGDLLLINAGSHGIAFDKTSGDLKWSSVGKLWSRNAGIGSYATPLFFTHGNKRCAAIFGQEALYAVDIKTGSKLWEYEWITKYDVNAADPLVSGNKIFISSGYGKGCALLDFSDGKPRKVWENRNMRNHFGSCVLIDGTIYGIDGNAGKGNLRCLDFATGNIQWSEDLGFASLIAAQNNLIILNEDAKLFIVKATPASFQKIAECTAIENVNGVCWTAPVLSNGRMYCRSSGGDLVCIDVRKYKTAGP